ncbi:hypothetical protein SESBI_13249 [Sesbania bispinosa]|nr:hypothetical protein SESBI_13249 [Sesbania bispinosa]
MKILSLSSCCCACPGLLSSPKRRFRPFLRLHSFSVCVRSPSAFVLRLRSPSSFISRSSVVLLRLWQSSSASSSSLLDLQTWSNP